MEALLKKYADVDVLGKDRKTAVYNAVEKGHTGILKLLLHSNPDLELTTKVRILYNCMFCIFLVDFLLKFVL